MAHDWNQDPAFAVSTPCQPVAPSGQGHALNDPRAVATAHALARAASSPGALSTDMENHADVLTVASGAVRDEIVAVFAAHGFKLADGTVIFPTAVDGPPRWKRVALRSERERMARGLGPCPPLRPIRSPSLAIADIMPELSQLPEHAFLPGTVTRLDFGCNVSSNYAQRFAHELVRLFCLRFDAEEKAILNAETDPSQRV